MNDIIGFINARLDEDEATGREAAADFARTNAARDRNGWAPLYDGPRLDADNDVDPFVTITPARILRQCAAMRAIVGEHQPAPVHWAFPGNEDDPFPFRCSRCATVTDPTPYPCRTLRHLAAIWRDHPDYRQEWAATLSDVGGA